MSDFELQYLFSSCNLVIYYVFMNVPSFSAQNQFDTNITFPNTIIKASLGFTAVSHYLHPKGTVKRNGFICVFDILFS